MEPQITSNPKNYIINKEEVEQYQCIICTEKSINMLRCKNCKQCLCNQCAIDTKIKLNKCPIRCSNGPLQLQRVSQLIIHFSCPYSPNCKVILKTIKQFQQHDRFCQFISPSQRQQKSHKWTFTCQKSHPLQIKIDTYKNLIKRVKCSECSQAVVTRALCRKCDKQYCMHCRPLPIYKNSCPIGHQLVKRKVSTLHYRCDICQLSPLIFGVDIYDDFICNFGICELCMVNWPQFKEEVHHIQNIDNYCDFIGDSKIVKKIKSQFQKIKSQHKLELIGQKKLNICDRCQKQKLCYKICKKCNKYYCLQCKKFEVFQNIKCQLSHSFKQINEENFSQQQLSQMEKKCLFCISKTCQTQPPDPVFYSDTICNVTLCKKCLVDLISYNFDVYYKYLSFSVRRCKKQPSHLLFYLPSQKQIYLPCSSCHQNSIIKFNCGMCQTPEFYCCACVSPPDLNKCYCGKLLQQKQNQRYNCLICKSNNQVYFCQPCGYFICEQCKYDNKNLQQQSENNQKNQSEII